jgi:hypothetical protein
MRIADLVKVENKQPHWAANKEYNAVRIQFPNGEEKTLLFTDSEIAKALDRAQKNSEDVPKISKLKDLFD